MSDLIERLRERASFLHDKTRQAQRALLTEAADELTALRSQVSELRADLEAIRNVALVAEDAARIRQFIASRLKDPNV